MLRGFLWKMHRGRSLIVNCGAYFPLAVRRPVDNFAVVVPTMVG